jgi:hypothetical protein
MMGSKLVLWGKRFGRGERTVLACLCLLVFLVFINLLFISPQPALAGLTPLEVITGDSQSIGLQATGELSDFDLTKLVPAASAPDADQIVGVYAPGVFSLSVIQQPQDKPWFVSSAPNLITQFMLAGEYGSLGFLAHNTLAGSAFFDLELGQEIIIIYGDGELARFRIGEVYNYQALDPDNPYSVFRELDGSNKVLSSTELFHEIYAKPHRAVFQTCLEGEGDPNWGRHFLIAYPVSGRFSLFDTFPF